MIQKGLLIAASLVFTSAAFALDKIAVYDPQKAMLSTEVAKQRVTALQSTVEFSALNARFESLKSDLDKLNKEAQTNGMTWSQEQKLAHRKKMEYTNADLQLAQKKLNAELNDAGKLVIQELQVKAQDILRQIVIAEKIGLLLNSNSALFANAEFDITAKVTDALNKSQ